MDRDFGQLVRAWRERLTPADVGLPDGGRRRAPGLRREELAGLVGISVDYLTRLEQSRASTPSEQVVAALARALRVTDRERELLFRAAGLAVPGPEFVPRHIAPSAARMLDRFTGTPVIVYDASWTLLTANNAYEAVMGETSRWKGWERNAVWRTMMDSASRARISTTARAHQQRQLLSELRLTASRYPRDPGVKALVSELTKSSPGFEKLWGAVDLGEAIAPARRKIIDHPAVGPLELDCDTLAIAGDDLRVMIYTATPGSDDAGRVELAITLGVQSHTRDPRVRLG